MPTTGDAIEQEVRAAAEAACGAHVAAVERIAGGGVGHRRFYRVTLAAGEPRTLVARVDRGEPAPGVLPEPPLEPLRSFLAHHGIPVPHRLGGDPARGIDLLEDAGRCTLEDAVATEPDAGRALYEEACDHVAALQRLCDRDGGVPAFRRTLDATLVRVKAARFAGAGLAAILGRPARSAEAACVHEAFEAVHAAIAAAPQRLAHRDYQSRNLLVRPAGATPRLVLIDVQGALLAPPEYDLVCLLRDSYVVLPEATRRALAERARVRLPDAPDPEEFDRRFDLLTVVRKGKDFALWHELAARGDPRFLRYAPATLDYVRSALGRVRTLDARLARLGDLLEAGACAR